MKNIKNCYKCKIGIWSGDPKCEFCDKIVCFSCGNFFHENNAYIRACDDCFTIMFNLNPRVDEKTSITLIAIQEHQKLMKWKKTLPAPVDDFSPTATEGVFWELIEWLVENKDKEIAGMFIIDDNDEINWVYHDSTGTKGGVDSGSGMATITALEEGRGNPNGQFHTHPGFDAYFSTTDDGDQMEFLLSAMSHTPNGVYTFMVYDRLTWRVHRYNWENGQLVSRRQGYVSVRGIELSFSARPLIPYTKYQLALPIGEDDDEKEHQIIKTDGTGQRPRGAIAVDSGHWWDRF